MTLLKVTQNSDADVAVACEGDIDSLFVVRSNLTSLVIKPANHQLSVGHRTSRDQSQGVAGL